MTWPANKALPKKLQSVRNGAQKAISPIMRPELAATDERRYIWYGARTNAGRDLPPYYLVYFLLVELLGFRDLGAEEKVAWSVPIEFEGKIYSIEHRKLGLGLFVPDPQTEEHQAKRIVSLIHKGVKIAEPYFEWLADQAIETSELNVTNNSSWVYERYEYLRNGFQRAMTRPLRCAEVGTHRTPRAKKSAASPFYSPIGLRHRWGGIRNSKGTWRSRVARLGDERRTQSVSDYGAKRATEITPPSIGYRYPQDARRQ